MADSGFANDGTASDTGAKQSFHDRISAATSVWNAQITSHAHAKTLSYSTSTANILVRNVTPPQPGDGTQTYGQTYVQTAYQPQSSADFYGICPHNRTTGDIALQYARIDMQTRSDWFTQDDNQRKYWESCTNRTTYTCSKLLDFQSVVTHELGHAIGEAHPETTAQNNAADCSNSDTPSTVYDDSTMCHVIPHYTTRQRTLTTWDTNSYAAHMNSF